MRSNEFLTDSIEIISEKTNSDEIIKMLEPLGYEAKKISNFTTKVTVPAKDRFAAIQRIKNSIENSEISANGKEIKYDGATIKVKPLEAQGARLEKEAGQIQALDNEIKQQLGNEPYIVLKVGNSVVKAAGAVKISGSVKADTAIVDQDGNQVAWISLKDGSTPKHFGQWGGITHLAKDPEIADFVTKLKTVVGDVMPQGPTYGKEITSVDLKNAVVFGKDFKTGQPGISNVNLVLQGNPQVKKIKDGFEVDATKSWANGDIPSNEYDPVITARFSSDRSDFGIKGARITLYPRSGRTWKQIDQEYERAVKQQNKQNDIQPINSTPQNTDQSDEVSRVASLAGVPKKPNVSTLQGTKLTSPGMTTLDKPQTESDNKN